MEENSNNQSASTTIGGSDGGGSTNSSITVRVAVRVRPLVHREIQAGCRECIGFYSSPSFSSSSSSSNVQQITIGKDKSFAFDHVFSPQATQQQVYTQAVHYLVESFLQGYNATVLAYGQTGSGKTYSMGSGFEATTAYIGEDIPLNSAENKGIIPRAVKHIYDTLENQTENGLKYELRCSFLELYNDELIDLLNPDSHEIIRFRDDPISGVEVYGVKEVQVTSPEELYSVLKKGSLSRTTGSTDMNTYSSRSHAIFTIFLKQKRPIKSITQSENQDPNLSEAVNFEHLSSRFHFVDLAGSERLKSTNAVGDRAKEGMNINMGLLALGNVISALGDESRKASYVNYRDHKLTRLLQNSLGGNSRTLMIACVSPSDSNLSESLSTLHYANRARNIKNKAMINQDLDALEVVQLRSRVRSLERQLEELKLSSGSMDLYSNNVSGFSHQANNDLLRKNAELEEQLQQSQIKIDVQKKRITELMEETMLQDLKLSSQEKDRLSLSSDGPFNSNTGELPEKTLKVVSDLQRKLETAYEELENANCEIEKLRRSTDATLLELVDEIKRDLHQQNESNDNDEEMTSNIDYVEDDSGYSIDEGDSSCDSKEQLGSNNKVKILDKLQAIENFISEKENLVAEIQQLNQMQQHYQEQLFQMDQERQKLKLECKYAVEKLKTNSKNPSDNQASVKALKENYEKKLHVLVEQMHSYRKKNLEGAKRLKQLSQAEQRLPILQAQITSLKRDKEILIRQTRQEKKHIKELRETSSKEIRTLSRKDMEKSMKIRRLEKENEHLNFLLKTRTQEFSERIRKLQRAVEIRNAKQNSSTSIGNEANMKSNRVFETNLCKLLDKCVIAQESKKIMEGLISKRERLFVEKENFEQRLESENVNNISIAERDECMLQLAIIKEEIQDVNTNIDKMNEELVQSNKEFDDCHSAIMNIIAQLDIYEARRILTMFVDDIISDRVDIRKKDAKIEELTGLSEYLREKADIALAKLKEYYKSSVTVSVDDTSPKVAPRVEMNSNSATTLIETVHSPKRVQISVSSRSNLNSPSEEHFSDDVFTRLTVPSSRSRANSMKTEIEVKETSGSNLLESSLVLKGHKGIVFDVAVQDHLVFTASQDSTVKIWDTNKTMEISNIEVSRNTFVRSVKIRNNLIFTASDSTIKVWDKRDNKLIKTLDGQLGKKEKNKTANTLLALHPELPLLFSATDNTICVWDIDNGIKIKDVAKHPSSVTALDFVNNGTKLLSVSKDRIVRTLPIADFNEIMEVTPPHYDAIHATTIIRKNLITGGNGFLRKWIETSNANDTPYLFNVKNVSKENIQNTIIQSITSCYNEAAFFTASKDGMLKLWNEENLSSNFEIKAHDSAINAITKSKDESFLFTASNDRTVKMWKVSPIS